MQSPTLKFVAIAIVGAAIVTVHATDSCDMSAIQSSLQKNGTTWHDSCAADTGVDVFAMTTFPTIKDALIVSQSRDCVNYLNQLNQEANSEIQCETKIGNQTIILAKLLTDLLTGKSSNQTDVSSGSMLDSISISDSSSASTSTSAAASDFTSKSESGGGSLESEKISSIDREESASESGNSAGIFATYSLTVIAAAASTLIAFT